jgi:hypothetical protein
MSVSIMEALMNADANLKNASMMNPFVMKITKEQLHNAVTLLEKGYSLTDEVEPLLEKYGKLENVPEK